MAPLPIRTRPFTIGLIDYVRVATLQYYRTWWFAMAAYPVFGLVAWFAFPDQAGIRWVAAACVLWPATVPLRALLFALRAAKRFGVPTTPCVYEDFVAFETGEGKGFKLRFASVLRVEKDRFGFALLMPRFTYAIVPFAAFETLEDRDRFEKHARDQVAKALDRRFGRGR
ncbi:MAG: hypothetical protein KIS66_16380 [Fimbriimonadaceae bacterium]|nr:hypothetical protein [Fimbriimonadaceae bacterium]